MIVRRMKYRETYARLCRFAMRQALDSLGRPGGFPAVSLTNTAEKTRGRTG